jgi:hypothetical protein
MFMPRLQILPEAQRRLWDELGATPRRFVLYGGTAIALRLGHRQSVDFDFFTFEPFVPQALRNEIPYLEGAEVLQSAPNTLTCRVERDGPVQLSYFALTIGQVATPEAVFGPEFSVAMPIDLAGTKMAVITQRAEARDYIDIHALLGVGIALPEMLGAAIAIYGHSFSPLVALKALSYHEEPQLAGVPAEVRRDLLSAVSKVDPSRLPTLSPIRARKDRI